MGHYYVCASFKKISPKMIYIFKHYKSLLLNFQILEFSPLKIWTDKGDGNIIPFIILLCEDNCIWSFRRKKVYRMNSLSKSWLINVGASTMACLILLKASFPSRFHLHTSSSLINAWKCLIISTNLEMNLKTKFILPKKDCMAFLFFRNAFVVMDSILSWSMIIPSLEIRYPKSFPSVTAKMFFFGFNEILYLSYTFQWFFSSS